MQRHSYSQTLPQAQMRLRNSIKTLSQDLSEWDELDREVMQNPLEQALRPTDDTVRASFARHRQTVSQLIIQYQLLLTLLDTASDN